MRVAFFGQTGPFAPDALRYMVSHQGAYELVLAVEGRRRSSGRHPHRVHEPAATPIPQGTNLRAIANAAGLPVLETCEVNAAYAVDTVREHRPDFIVCVGFDRLFSADLLSTAGRGGINAHPSKLPRFRGPSPLFWTLRQGLRVQSVSLHALDPKEDHGPIYAQQDFVAPPTATGEELYTEAGRLAARMLVALLEEASQGELRPVQQEHRLATRAPRPKAEDALVNPEEWRCEALLRFANGAPFFRAPWMRLGDDVFFVRRGLRVELGQRLPAHYVQTGEEGRELLVQCRDGVLALEVQI